MSRGFGRVERAALEILKAGEMLSVLDIAARATKGAADANGRVLISHAVYNSFARALRSIARAGHVVDLGRHWRDGRRLYAIPSVAQKYRDRVVSTFGKAAALTAPGMQSEGEPK
jgi:hypothetical protein